MKTKHIQYKSSLFIAVLSLSTLSSCVNTRQELGMGGGNSKGNQNVEDGRNRDNSKYSSPFNSSMKDAAKEVAKGVTYAGVGAAIGYGVSRYNSDSSNCPNGSSNSSFGSNSGGWNTSSAWGDKR